MYVSWLIPPVHKCSSRWTPTPGKLASTVSHLASPCSSTCQTRSSRSCNVINLIHLRKVKMAKKNTSKYNLFCKKKLNGGVRGGFAKRPDFYVFFGNLPLNPGCLFLSDWPISQQIHGWDDAGTQMVLFLPLCISDFIQLYLNWICWWINLLKS